MQSTVPVKNVDVVVDNIKVKPGQEMCLYLGEEWDYNFVVIGVTENNKPYVFIKDPANLKATEFTSRPKMKEVIRQLEEEA